MQGIFIILIFAKNLKLKDMKTLNGITLKFDNKEPRNNYMSLPDLFQDLTTECLINLLGNIKELKNQMWIIRELESKRLDEIGEEKLFELLENCNGF